MNGGRHVVFVTWKAGNAPAFEAAKRLGHEVTLIRSVAMERSQNIDLDASGYRQFIDTVHTLADATDPDVLRECVIEINERRRIDGFVATVDALVVPVARIAEELGIPFTSWRGASTAKQKNACRAALAAAGVDSTRYAVVTELAQAREFAARTGFPVVVKPASGSGSEGAHIVGDDAALAELFASAAAAPVYRHGLLVEEYLTGTFVSAEIAVSHGRTLRLAVTDRKTWPGHEALELGVTIPAVLDRPDHDAVLAFAERVVQAIDLRLGIFHVEVMLTERGPRLIELNPRIMGSCLPNLFRLAGGGDIFELLVRIYLDEPVDLPAPVFDRFATVRWFGAAHTAPRPAAVPDLSFAASEGDAVHSLKIRFPESGPLLPCRGNLGNFGEVQVVHEDYRRSVGIAEGIVEKIEAQLGIELTR